jgi:hypothetical protein
MIILPCSFQKVPGPPTNTICEISGSHNLFVAAFYLTQIHRKCKRKTVFANNVCRCALAFSYEQTPGTLRYQSYCHLIKVSPRLLMYVIMW